jgi:hypothetical protein
VDRRRAIQLFRRSIPNFPNQRRHGERRVIQDNLEPTGGKLFDPFSFPWRDERRSDLIRAFLTATAERSERDPTGAVQAITALTFVADLDEQWAMILELIAASPDDDSVLQAIAASPLEGLLGRFDAEAIDRIEADASRQRWSRRKSGCTRWHTTSFAAS